MTIPRSGISDKHWRKIKDFLTRTASNRGRPAKNDRAKFNGVLWILRTGAPWRDLPLRYGKWSTVYARFRTWSAHKAWNKILSYLRKKAGEAGELNWNAQQIDGTVIRVHQHAAGAKVWGPNDILRLNFDMGIGKSKGGWTSKIIIRTDGNGRPLKILLVPGNRHESVFFEECMEDGALMTGKRGRPRTRPQNLIGDKGFNSKRIRKWLRQRGINAVIPKQRNQKRRGPFNKELYRQRNRVERIIGVFKQSRRLATRYEKLAHTFLAFWHIASIFIWLTPPMLR